MSVERREVRKRVAVEEQGIEEGSQRIDSQEALEVLFENVRRTYFPRWRRGKGWSIRLDYVPGRPKLGGLCDLETRTIWIAPQQRDDENVEAIVFHETTHAIVGSGHGVRFQRRMLKAADDAEAQGNAALAAELRQEVVAYADSPRHRVADMYSDIRDAACEISDYHTLLHVLSEQDGLLPEEFERRYRRARRVYDEKRREVEEEKRLEAQLLRR